MKQSSVPVKILTALVMLVSMLGSTSCTSTHAATSSESYMSKKVAVDNFTSLAISGGFEVNITQKVGAPSIILKGETEAIKNIVLNQSGENVSISFRKNREYDADDVKIDISLPTLKNLSVSAGCTMTMDYFKSNETLNLSITSGADFSSSKTLSVPILNLSVSSGADVNINQIAVAQNLNVKASSGGDLSVSKVTSSNTNISVSSGSDAEVDEVISNFLNIVGSSGSDIEVSSYKGTSLSITASSSSDITVGGYAKELKAGASSSASIDLSDFSADKATLSASSSGDISLGKYKDINISTSSGGTIDLN